MYLEGDWHAGTVWRLVIFLHFVLGRRPWQEIWSPSFTIPWSAPWQIKRQLLLTKEIFQFYLLHYLKWRMERSLKEINWWWGRGVRRSKRWKLGIKFDNVWETPPTKSYIEILKSLGTWASPGKHKKRKHVLLTSPHPAKIQLEWLASGGFRFQLFFLPPPTKCLPWKVNIHLPSFQLPLLLPPPPSLRSHLNLKIINSR